VRNVHRQRPAIRPAGPSAFVGRDRECASVAGMLASDARLITLTGTGGCGKTRLALEIARRVSEATAWPLAVVELASLRDPALIVGEISRAVGRWATPGDLAVADLARRFASEDFLLVIDNVEQLLPAAAHVIAELVDSAPGLRVLVTSRVRLNVSAERLLTLDPLTLPADDADASDIAVSPAVAVFLDRAVAVDPDFVLTSANAAAVSGICRRLDGLPLAIELAAARLRVLPPKALLARVELGVSVLDDGPLDRTRRQRTLRDTIAWSVDMLPPAEAVLFGRLGIFAGGFDLESAFAIAAPGVAESEDVLLSKLTLLVDHNLVRVARDGAEPRFSMLETIREYAFERVDERRVLRDRHLAYFVRLAEEAGAAFDGPGHADSVERLAVVASDIRAALRWADATRDTHSMLRLTAALGLYWRVHGDLHEARIWLERALALPGAASDPSAAMALVGLGRICIVLGDRSAIRDNPRRALEAARASGDRRAEAWALLGSAIAPMESGAFDEATTLLNAALEIGLGEEPGVACYSLIQLGEIASNGGDHAAARDRFEQAINVAAQAGNAMRLGVALDHLGTLLLTLGEPEDALERFTEASRVTAAIRARDHLGWAVRGRASALVDLGRLDEARLAINETLELASRSWSTGDQIVALAAMAAWLGAAGLPSDALRAWAAVERARETYGLSAARSSRERAESLAAADRRAAGASAAAVAWAVGHCTRLETAVRAARDAMDAANPRRIARRAAPCRASALTPREVEVLLLVGQGRSDGEIAERLYITKKTASTHVANIKGKLGTDNRVETALEAVRLGLLTLGVEPTRALSG
jgi:predicted ATPase/DNA-binding CsgD family transcriptional regulator